MENVYVYINELNAPMELLVAAKLGDLARVRELLSHPSCDLLAKDEEGNTALHIAASRGHHDMVLELASRYTAPSGAGVNNEGQTPLHLACYKGGMKCVDPLAIKFPKEINLSDNTGNTPVMAASLSGHKTLVSLLKERYKVDVDSKEGELPKHKEDKHKPKPSDETKASSCLLAAAKQGSLSVVRALVSHPSCNLLARNEKGNTALHIAASTGHHDVVLELASQYTAPSGEVYAGSRVNNNGQTPLHLACSSGWVNCTRTLAKVLPEDLNVKNDYDNPPLRDAALFGHSNVVDCLCEEFGCDVDSLGHYNSTCLILACCGGHTNLVHSLLVKYGSRKGALDDLGGVASTSAAFYGHTHLLQMLLDGFNFSPNFVTLKDGQNLLHQACIGKHYETANVLISKYNLDPLSKDTQRFNALHHICGSFIDSLENVGNFHTPADIEITAFVDRLIGFKCDPMDKGNKGRNALHLAAFSGQTEVVMKLVRKYKCLVECKDNDDNTPLHYAAKRGHVHVVIAI